MKKRIPLYELITRLDSKEKIFIRKFITENLNTASKDSYVNFYNILLKVKELSDEEVLDKLSKNKLKNYYPEAKFYLNKLILKALRIHYTINPPKKNETDNFLSNLEKQKEIYIYFSKGLYKEADRLCKKYAKKWEENKDFDMLSFAYKKMYQIELLTTKKPSEKNKYYKLYTEIQYSNSIKSNCYYLSLKIEKDLQTNSSIRTNEDREKFENYLKSNIISAGENHAIYYWYVQILCHFALLNFEKLNYCFEKINGLVDKEDAKEIEIVSHLQLYSRLTFFSIYINDIGNFYKFKSYYFHLLSKASFLTDMHKSMYNLNAKVMESLFLFKQKKYNELFIISIPQLDIDNYIFEGTIMLHYVDLLIARGKAHLILTDFEKAYDYFNFIIDYKVKLRVPSFTVCNAFFHIWLIRYLSKEYKVLTSIANRYKIYLSNQKIGFPLEKALFKFMYSASNNYTNKNIARQAKKLIETLEELSNETIEKNLIDQLDILSNLKELMILS